MRKKISLVLVLTMLLSLFSAVNISAANQNLPNQKGYIEMPLTNVSESDTNIMFKFNVLSSGVQKLNIYAIEDNWEKGITWNSAPKNNKNLTGFDGELAGSVIVTGAGEYSIDVTDIAKAKKAKGLDKITFAISGELRNGFENDFSDLQTVNRVTTSVNAAFGTYGEYVQGGDGATSASVSLSSDVDNTNNGYSKSLRLQKVPSSASTRYKFYNGLKTTGLLTNDDLGRKFRVSFSVLNPVSSGEATNMTVGFMSAANGQTSSGTATNATTFKGNKLSVNLANNGEWTPFSFDFEITQEVIEWQAAMLTFSGKFTDVYVDDIKVTDISDSTKISTGSLVTYAPDFDSMTASPYYKNGSTSSTTINIFDTANEHAYRPGGGGGATLYLTSDANYPDSVNGKSMRVEKNDPTSTNNVRRLKFYNAIKKSALDSSDIGRTFKISAYTKLVPTAGTNTVQLTLGMMAENNSGTTQYGYNTYGTTATATMNSTEWTPISLEYTIAQNNIDYQVGMPSFIINSPYDYYLDDFTVTEIINDASKFTAPRLAITKSDSSTAISVASKTAYIEDEENTFTAPSGSDILINDKGYLRNDLQTISSSYTGTFEARNSFGHTKQLKNNTGSDLNIILLTALYKSDILVDIDFDAKPLSVDEFDTYTTSISLPKDLNDDYYTKTFMWNGDNMKPLCASDSYPKYYSEDDVVVMVKAPASGKNYSSFDVFVKGTKVSSNKYSMYQFQYINNPLTNTTFTSGDDVRQNAELYRVKEAYKAERTGEYEFVKGAKLLQEGEIEMAIREAANEATGNKKPGDFIGGFHGDEHFSSVTLTVDGTQVPLNKAGNYTGKEIRFIQNSVVNRCNTPGDNLINHRKDYKVTKNGIDLNQTAEWLQSTKIDIAYLTMFTIVRESSERITDYVNFFWSDGTEAAMYDVSNYGVSKYINTIPELGQVAGAKFADYAYSPGNIYAEDGKYVNKVHLWSASGDLDAYCSTQTVRGLSNSFTNLTARVYGDNKCYFGSHDGMNVSAGDIWEVNNNYNIKINN